MSSLLDPAKWVLLHQEGALLIEQINRMISPQEILMAIRYPTLTSEFYSNNNNNNNGSINEGDISDEKSLSQITKKAHSPLLSKVDLAYLGRSIQRLEHLESDYLDAFQEFKYEVGQIKAQILQKSTNPGLTTKELGSRGPLNLGTSPTDVVVAYDSILSMFYSELLHKNEIIGIFIAIYENIYQNILSSQDTGNLINSNHHKHSFSPQNTQKLQTNQNIDEKIDQNNLQSLFEKWPWLIDSMSLINNTYNLTDGDNNNNNNTDDNNLDLNPPVEYNTQLDHVAVADDEVLYRACRTDLNGLVALFYQRIGFDVPQYNRLISILKSGSNFGEMKGIVETVSVISSGVSGQ
jgi:hypothetical protein